MFLQNIMHSFVKVIKSFDKMDLESELEKHLEGEGTETDNKEINDITLQYMMNREWYESYILSQNETTKEETMEERKFYRSRIFQLTKVLLLTEKERQKYFEMNPSFDITKIQFDVFLTFDAFVKNAIQNFQMVDTTDILQQDYPEETKPAKEYGECGECGEGDYVETLELEGLEGVKKSTLDKFVIMEKQEKVLILPLQKSIDLTDPSFKKKGIRKWKK